MKKQWLVPLIVLLLIALPVYGFIRQYLVDKIDHPVAQHGVIDLRQWDYSTNGTVSLNGEWDIYPSALLNPQDFQNGVSIKGNIPAQSIQVPQSWNKVMQQNGSSAFGYATYHLRILVKDPQQAERLYGIHVKNIRTAHRIFINGQLAGSSGTPGTTDATTIPNNIPYNTWVPVDGNTVDLVVQVANYSYSSGGIVYPINFGDMTAITKEREISIVSDIAVMGGFLLPGLYVLILYQMRRKDQTLLYLGFFCIAAFIHVLTHGEKLFSMVLPQLSYELVLRVQLGCSVIFYYCLLFYVSKALPNVAHRLVLRIYRIMTILLLAMTVVTPTSFFTQIDQAWFICNLLTIMYVLYIVVRAVIRKQPHSQSMLLSVHSLAVVAIISLISLRGITNNTAIIPIEVLFFVITQCLMIGRQFALSFQQIENLSQQLLTLDELKNEFIANTSHALRTPLHGMINMTESLVEGAAGPLADKQVEQLIIVSSTGHKLAALINDILDYSKLKNGDLLLDRKAVNLRTVAESVLEIVSYTAAGRQIVFIQEWPEYVPPLYTDEDRLSQILYNLLGNAVKFTEQGEIRFIVEVGTGQVTFAVIDTGIGIEEDRYEDIFKSFEQGLGLSEQSYAGTGLGLSITRKLVELNDGQITVDSVVGQGSTFTVTLPTADVPVTKEVINTVQPMNAQSEVKQSISKSKPILQREKEPLTNTQEDQAHSHHTQVILIVDDDPVNLRVLNNILSLQQYVVIEAQSGKEALDKLRYHPKIDLMITDWMMPGMSGLELCRQVRQRYSLSELPILMLTARSRPEDIQNGFAAGVNDFLGKPVHAIELRARVNTLLELKTSVQTVLRTEMAFLQAQIKPHFLYNALNTIIAMCSIDPDQASELLIELSQYLRRSFDFQNRDQLTTLNKEIELIQSYLSLEKARFDERLQIVWDVDRELGQMIPPLSIQPLVENAVRHGLMNRAAGGILTISIQEQHNDLIVRIHDDGIGMAPEKIPALLAGEGTVSANSGVGVINIHKRLLAMYGQGLHIESTVGKGTTISFMIPGGEISA